MISFFSHSKPQIIKNEPEQQTSPSGTAGVQVPETSPRPKYEYKFAFIDAHTTSSPGARNYKKEYENSWSTRINTLAINRLIELGYGEYVFHVIRPHEKNYTGQCKYVAQMLSMNQVTHAMSTHFNAAGIPGARGCEFLIPITTKKDDNKMADFASDLLNERLGIRERKDDGVYEVPSGHRGSTMLFYVNREGIAMCIAEPVFADYKTSESQAIFENEENYVEILVEVAINAIKGNFNKQ